MARALIGGGVLWVVLLWLAAGASAGETLADPFDRVHPSVVVIRTTEPDVPQKGDGHVTVAGLGSGVLIAADGKVLTADHAASEMRSMTSTYGRSPSARTP
jgi:S1-C subfamily serine protease